MAAPTVAKRAKTVRGKTKKDPNRVTVKSVLFSPYAPEWPLLATGDTPQILEEIKRTFEPYTILPTMKKMKMAKTQWSQKKWTPDSVKRAEDAKQLKAELRTHIVFGVNATTRCLEKGQLCLVVVCRSTKPPLLTSHLMSLSACRGVPALAMSGLSETLSPMMNARAIIAVGFKKSTSEKGTEFSKLTNFIIARTPPLELPWLQYKDFTLEELREKVVEVSNKRKRGREENVPRNPSAGSATKCKSETQVHAGSGTHESADDPSSAAIKTNAVKLERKIVKDGQKTTSLMASDSSPEDHQDRVGISTGVKRTSVKAGLDDLSQRNVSKVPYVPVKIASVRSIPEQLKKEWKAKKKNKKKKH